MKTSPEQPDLLNPPESPCRVGSVISCRAHSYRILLWLLAVYVLAIVCPGPGEFLRSLSVPGVLIGTPNSMSHLVLGCLLFCAGLTVETARMPRIDLQRYPLTLLATWVIPVLVVAGLGQLARQWGVPDGIVLGLVIAAAMPVANASVGWTHLGGGSLPLILAVLIGATVTAPLVTPLIIHLLALVCLPEKIHAESVLPLKDLAGFLGFWVVAPAVFGAIVGLWSRRQGVVWSIPWLRRVSIVCLLLLNYMNASSALPLIRSESLVAQGLVLTFLNNGLLILIGWFAARWLKIGRAEVVSITLACGMRNTGAALVLAGSQIQQDPVVIMTIVLQTLLQNVFAGVLISLIPQQTVEKVLSEPEASAKDLSQVLNQGGDQGQAARAGTGEGERA